MTHPAVAQIYGVESWRGRPFLVVEFLAGGTLEDRLRDGPIAAAEAVSLVARLAGALEALHLSVRCSSPEEGLFTAVALELDAGNRIFTTLPVVPVLP